MRITLFYTVSADGFIARTDDSTPWQKSVIQNYFDFCASADSAIVGHRTYRLLIDDPMAARFLFKKIIVVSRQTPKGIKPPFTSATSPSEAIDILSRAGCSEVVLMGGSQLATSFLSDGLIDEIRLEFDSILLGDGIRPFSKPIDLGLTLISTERSRTDSVVTCYRVSKGDSAKSR
jgi:dihydrofolate reductase